jgi:hypothetical protein
MLSKEQNVQECDPSLASSLWVNCDAVLNNGRNPEWSVATKMPHDFRRGRHEKPLLVQKSFISQDYYVNQKKLLLTFDEEQQKNILQIYAVIFSILN